MQEKARKNGLFLCINCANLVDNIENSCYTNPCAARKRRCKKLKSKDELHIVSLVQNLEKYSRG